MVKLPPEILNNEYYKDLTDEFYLNPIKYNGDKLLLQSTKYDLTILIDFKKHKNSVTLGSKLTRESTYFSPDLPNNDKYNYDISFMLASLLVMDTVWEYNYDKYFYDKTSFPHTNFFYTLLYSDPDSLNKLLEGTEITTKDIEDGIYKSAANKYHLLKNVLNYYPAYFTKLEYLPKSLSLDFDLSDEEKEILNVI